MLTYAFLQGGGGDRPDSPSAQRRKPTATESAQTTILVVDDEPWVRQLAARMLRDSGFLVAEASSAQEALQQLASSQEIRLVLTDVVMPGMDGVKLADAIQERYPDRRVVLMTAYPGLAGKIASHTGPRPILPKPFSSAQLMQRIREVLGNH
jgi:two-component system, cell cycle sensor histidine kinase and response regulator CckA